MPPLFLFCSYLLDKLVEFLFDHLQYFIYLLVESKSIDSKEIHVELILILSCDFAIYES